MKYAPRTREQIEAESLEMLKQMRPLDDDLMREMFRDNLPLAEFVLRIITGKYDLKLISQQTQYDLKRLVGGRSICLDVLGTDSEGQLYDLEIQRADSGATPRRARYHSSAMDIEFLDKAQKFEELPNTYTIFITENDIFGEDKAIYRIERINTDTGKPFSDGEHIMYVNGSYNNENDTSDIAKLMHDFRCCNAADMHFELMAKTMHYFKEEAKGESNMCKLWEDRIKEYGKLQSMETAYILLSGGKLSLDEIAEASKLTLEEVKEIAEENELVTT